MAISTRGNAKRMSTEEPALQNLEPWLCFCGATVVGPEWEAHSKTCSAYENHRLCICRGGGAYWPHKPQAGQKDHVSIFASCVPCGLKRIPFEAPARAHATEYLLWAQMVVQPRVDEVQKTFECPIPVCNLRLRRSMLTAWRCHRELSKTNEYGRIA